MLLLNVKMIIYQKTLFSMFSQFHSADIHRINWLKLELQLMIFVIID